MTALVLCKLGTFWDLPVIGSDEVHLNQSAKSNRMSVNWELFQTDITVLMSSALLMTSAAVQNET